MRKKDDLGTRMKEYEFVAKHYLTRRMPVIIRLDGKAFHSFCKHLKKPFDSVLTKTMQDTMKYLCENIQGCVFGYTQSDEITLILIDYKRINSSAWFDNNIQKMTSVSASMATLAFNNFFKINVENFINENKEILEYYEYCKILPTKIGKALFDSRVFNIPKEEVVNNLIWRQQDATRNSIQSMGQHYFSHKQLHNKNCNDIQDMLMQKYNINWNNLPIYLKRGSCCYKIVKQIETQIKDEIIIANRNIWVVDEEPPIFTKDRNYIEKWIYITE